MSEGAINNAITTNTFDLAHFKTIGTFQDKMSASRRNPGDIDSFINEIFDCVFGYVIVISVVVLFIGFLIGMVYLKSMFDPPIVYDQSSVNTSWNSTISPFPWKTDCKIKSPSMPCNYGVELALAASKTNDSRLFFQVINREQIDIANLDIESRIQIIDNALMHHNMEIIEKVIETFNHTEIHNHKIILKLMPTISKTSAVEFLRYCHLKEYSIDLPNSNDEWGRIFADLLAKKQFDLIYVIMQMIKKQGWIDAVVNFIGNKLTLISDREAFIIGFIRADHHDSNYDIITSFFEDYRFGFYPKGAIETAFQAGSLWKIKYWQTRYIRFNARLSYSPDVFKTMHHYDELDEIVKYCVENDFEVNYQWIVAIAIKTGNSDIINYLLDKEKISFHAN